jgi:hypothetical protein
MASWHLDTTSASEQEGLDMDCWHDEIDHALTEAEIVRNAGEYLLLWAPRDLSAQALGLARMRIESSADIERVSARLAPIPAQGDHTCARSAHLRELAHYFRHAATRLVELRRIPPRPGARLPASIPQKL